MKFFRETGVPPLSQSPLYRSCWLFTQGAFLDAKKGLRSRRSISRCSQTLLSLFAVLFRAIIQFGLKWESQPSFSSGKQEAKWAREGEGKEMKKENLMKLFPRLRTALAPFCLHAPVLVLVVYFYFFLRVRSFNTWRGSFALSTGEFIRKTIEKFRFRNLLSSFPPRNIP